MVGSAPDTSFVINLEGIPISCGFSGNYQTGTGQIEEVVTPTPMGNAATAGKELVGVGAGGQFGMLFAKHE